MLFILSLIHVQGLLLEEDFHLSSPYLLTQFSGKNLSIEFSAKFSENSSGPIKKLHFEILEEGKVPSCEGSEVELSEDWSDEISLSLQPSGPLFFFVGHCEDGQVSVSVKLKVQDWELEHYSSEYFGIFYILGFAVFCQVTIMAFSIFGIYKETHEEVPLALIFVISLLYTIALMFHFLFIWIYGVDGSSYRFVLIFSKFFEVFARVSLIGILLLIFANRFNPSDFSIEEYEFVAFLAFIGIEFVVEVVGIVRFEVLRHFDMWKGPEGILNVFLRIGIVWVTGGHKFRKIGARLEGFGKIDYLIRMIILLPTLQVVFAVVFITDMKASALTAVEMIGPVVGLAFLLFKFLSVNFVGVLPLKRHNF
jgi:hypothetical protein